MKVEGQKNLDFTTKIKNESTSIEDSRFYNEGKKIKVPGQKISRLYNEDKKMKAEGQKILDFTMKIRKLKQKDRRFQILR